MDSNEFRKARELFRSAVIELSEALPNLKKIQQVFVNNRTGNTGKNGTKAAAIYTIETPVVYNTALDDITNKDEIKLI